MYENLRNNLKFELLKAGITRENAVNMLNILDCLMKDYELKPTERSLVVRENTAPQILEMYLACKAVEGYSDQTLRNKRIFLTKFLIEIGKPVKDIEINDVRAWMYVYKKKQNISDRTMETYRIALHAFFGWAKGERIISDNPVDNIHPLHVERRERIALTPYELEKVREACQTPRECAIIELLFSTGCRVSELCGLKKSDIDMQTNEVKLYGKRKKERISYLNPKAKIAVTNYWRTRTDDSEYAIAKIRAPENRPVLPHTIENVVREIRERSDITKPLCPHIMRHTTATIGLNAGMPVENLQVLLGHEKIETTIIYAKTNRSRVKNDHERYIV